MISSRTWRRSDRQTSRIAQQESPPVPHQKGAPVRKLITLMVVAALAAAMTVSATVAFAATKKVGVRGLKFSPKTLKVKRGTTVKWSWSGSVPHNVVGKGFKSKTTTKGSVSHKFTKKGTYTVVCTLHKAAGMTMKIKVS